MLQLRPYQQELSKKGSEVLKKYGLVYFAMEVRTGKTFVALETARLSRYKNVLIITKLKAFSSIQADYEHYKHYFDLTIINKESVHKLNQQFELIIIDEAHGFGAFPKPGTHTKKVKKLCKNKPIIFLSGTPHIESGSKIYHQFWLSNNSPFKHYKNFYTWFKDYGIPKTIYTNYGQSNDYSNSKLEKVMNDSKHLFLTYSQKEAGFVQDIKEQILYVKMKDQTYQMIEKLKKDRVIQGKNDTLLADTAVKLQICLSELFSGTIKLESGKSVIIDYSKGNFIKEYFKGKKIAIMYCFIKEKELLKHIFQDEITDDLEEFKITDKNYMGQIKSVSEGVSLKEADALIFYNMHFSGTAFVQGRDRMSFLGREKNNVYIVCAENGIEEKIYKVVKEKKRYSEKIFKKDFGFLK